MTQLPGLDLAALTAWLDAERPGLRAGPLEGAVIAGGKSNLTYRVGDGTTNWALRRPPLAHVLPTAHDMAREFRVISALAGTEVPVAEAIALCGDPAVIGAPFYLMSFVDGVVLDRPGVLGSVDAAGARRACDELVDTLRHLHDLDPEQIGLGDFGRPEGFLPRQLRRWGAQWDASQTQPRPELTELLARLDAGLPVSGPPAIVHGDYRLTNMIYTPDLSRIAAVVDWEMATLGDPLADLGLMLVYHALAADSDLVMPRLSPSDGFLSTVELTERYALGSGRDLTALDWYVAFGYFKLAVIAEGIHHRYLQGQTVGEGFAQFGTAVPRILAAGLDALAGAN